MRFCTAGILALMMACSTARPVAAPTAESLAEFLRGSAAARAIAAAAEAEGVLSAAPAETEQLRIVMDMMGIGDLQELEDRLRRVVDEAPILLAALERRTRAGRKGDVAHWASLVLLALDDRDPGDLHELRGLSRWDDRYRTDVLALRGLHGQGRLREVALGPPADGPLPAQVLRPPIPDEHLPVFRVRRPSGYWPVFPAPGARGVVGTQALVVDAAPAWDDWRILVRRLGLSRVHEPLDGPVPCFLAAADGTLVADGSEAVALAPGTTLELLVEVPGVGDFVRLAGGCIARLPDGCCFPQEQPDAVWWLRLSAGEAAGGWIQAPRGVFEVRYPAWERRMQEYSEERRRGRLGRLGTGGTWDVEGARLIYWVEGDVAASAEAGTLPLVVLHGGPGLGSAYLREPLTELLAKDRALLFFDQRGSGYSEGRDDPTRLAMDWLVSDIDALRRAADVERIDLLGHSFGGLLALHYALRHPDRVRRIVLVDPDPASRAEWETFRARVEARLRGEDLAELAAIEARDGWQDSPEATTRWLSLRLRGYVADPERTPVQIAFDDVTLASFRATGPAIRADLGDWDLHPRLPEVQPPVLIVTGSHGLFAPEALERLAAGLPNARLETLESAGHFPFLEVPEAFARRVRAFLAE